MQLTDWLEWLGSHAVGFCEPVLGDRLTAVAYLGPRLREFGRLRLL